MSFVTFFTIKKIFFKWFQNIHIITALLSASDDLMAICSKIKKFINFGVGRGNFY